MTDVKFDHSVANAKITPDDVEKVRKYVSQGLALPQDAAGVEARFTSAASGTAEISTTSILELFKQIHDHSKSWSAIETNMQKAISALSSFKMDFDNYAQPAVDEIKKMPGYKDFSQQLKDMDASLALSFKPLVENADQNSCASMAEIFGGIIESIEEKRKTVSELGAQLKLFESTLKEPISSSVGRKLKATDAVNTLKEITEINNRFAALVPLVKSAREKLDTQYSDFFWWIFNPQKIRSEEKEGFTKLKELYDENNTLVARKEKLNALSGLFEQLSSFLDSLYLVVSNAIAGVNQFENV
ncbi:hypothetical protein [Pseudomonas antarctica]|uniref:hypothetical protein n=1 Tax=Pseudomonas antarctica TaxID=219572 RepID=UPI00387AF623